QLNYLIRADTRAGTTWYELSHDRFIIAVIDSNDAWRASNLADWQVAAWEWQKNGSQRELLLRTSALQGATSPKSTDHTDYEHDFLSASHLESRHHGVTMLPSLTITLIAIIAVETVVILLFILGVL